MQVHLCYKPYQFKMSLGAMKAFKEATGKDLWSTLITFVDSWSRSKEEPELTRYREAYKAVDFETAVHAAHCMIHEYDKSISMDEIEDAMFRCGWLPNADGNDKGAPYPIVLINMALQIHSTFSSDEKAKKRSARSREK